MANYTYPPAPVFVETTGELAIGATDGDVRHIIAPES